VNLEIEAGELFALVGESGSGKSITALSIMRLLPEEATIDRGKILLSGLDLLRLPEYRMRDVRGSRVSMIFQEPMSSLNPVMTVGDQIAEVILRHQKAGNRQVREMVAELLDSVGIAGPSERLSWYPHQLSGGQKQRVMIAMALACRPKLLVADEPTTALDVTIQAQVLSLLKDIQRNRRLAVLLITHDLGVVANIADRLAVMRRGRILETAPARTFFRFPRHEYSRELITTVPGPGTYRQEIRSKQPVLELHDLKVHFPVRKGIFQRTVSTVRAVDGIELEVFRGETVALVGESGSGKSTVGRAVLRLLDPTGGIIKFEGRNINDVPARAMRTLRKDLQIIFQDPYSSMNPRMTVADIIKEGMNSLDIESGQKERDARVVELMEQVGLPPELRRRYPHEFSGGQRQRICIARVLAVSPKLIVCDEPTSALDVSVRAHVLDLLKELQERLGVSYLFITHDLSLVPLLAHRIAVMKKGRIVEQGPVQTVMERPRHEYTRTLLSAVLRIGA